MEAPEDLVRLADALERGLAAAFGGDLANDEGWSRDAAAPKRFGRWTVLVTFRRQDRTLGFLVAPKDTSEPAYGRSTRYDIVYFSEDVPDDRQDEIYRRDRAMIDRFTAWVRRWDDGTVPSPS